MVNVILKVVNANVIQLKNQSQLSKVKCGLVMIAQLKVAQMTVAQKVHVLKLRDKVQIAAPVQIVALLHVTKNVDSTDVA